MVTYSLYDMVTKVNGGGIVPIGETNYDNKAWFRLKEMEDLLDYLIDDMVMVYKLTGAEYSIDEARKEAFKWLKELYETLGEIMLDEDNI